MYVILPIAFKLPHHLHDQKMKCPHSKGCEGHVGIGCKDITDILLMKTLVSIYKNKTLSTVVSLLLGNT